MGTSLSREECKREIQKCACTLPLPCLFHHFFYCFLPVFIVLSRNAHKCKSASLRPKSGSCNQLWEVRKTVYGTCAADSDVGSISILKRIL